METKEKKKMSKGFTGLVNLGNTCFMNAALQSLAHTGQLNQFLDTYGEYEDENGKKKKKFQDKMKKNPEALILVEWDNLREMMWSENCVISPGGFLGSLQRVASIKNKQIFTGFAQNDLPEFLGFLINCFHAALSREVIMNINGIPENATDELAVKSFKMLKDMYKKEYSEILTMFFGISISNIISLKDETYSISPEPYFMLELPIPKKNKHPSIFDCLDLYTERELLDDDNKYLNEKTKELENVYKCIKFWSFPDILIINLKRFNKHMKKNRILVDFPLEDFDLSKYVVGYNKTSYVYDLYAICNHSGNVMGGHYTASIKGEGNKWFIFNDTNITEIQNTQELKNEKAYCFFYRKKKLLNNI